MNNQNGFTLIELLVVVAIIGILAATVITQASAHRASAQCAKVESDVRNAISSLESEFARNESYTGTNLISSPGVSLSTTATGSNPGTVTGSHPACTRGTLTYTGSTGDYSWSSSS